ncbi:MULTISPECIES: Sir2 family NAD-dependent protein deacetylase [unclassified Amycolatopsis]|uniref:SIR2 family NAD-dependent protein deacylase n=1 Tax=unclassified Amycolatopsis TaxID=2618356 RepID=UPI0028742864|nr:MULTISPECIES: Sir2 family NAD-dependent protein deacetylase [unclassified Amycolatopsis]MDS0135635.1 Sir2 family NAD-dependent protein deacetylase [Amycolatopsis sp. 505]MDS0148349.1 Sir2 family NAD-dependent protein deacetylase [Amycolatopsis sp. CM201R]
MDGKLIDRIRGARRVAALTGAGISTASGIPDYRGPDGVWTRTPSAVNAFTLENFMADAGVRREFWRAYRGHAAWRAEPNAAHRALAELDSAGVAVRVLTQNVDGLHQRAGLAERKVLELHGSVHTTRCTGCAAGFPTADVLEAGEDDPSCRHCGGILKLDVVLFGQLLDGGVLGHARNIAAASGLFFAIGSTLQVEPAASLCTVAVRAGATLVVVNRDPTPYDDDAAFVLRDDIEAVVPELCAAVRP